LSYSIPLCQIIFVFHFYSLSATVNLHTNYTALTEDNNLQETPLPRRTQHVHRA